MEKLCKKTCNLDVLWKGFVERDKFLVEKADIESLWDILNAVHEDFPRPNRPSNGESRPP